MQVQEMQVEGLKRHLKLTLPNSHIGEKIQRKLVEIQKDANVKGFRPGKVPLNHIKRIYGRNIAFDIINQSVNETVKQTIGKRNEKNADQPKLIMMESEEKIQQIIDGKEDLVFEVKYEILPKIEIDKNEINKAEIQKITAKIEKKDIDEALKKTAQQQKKFVPKNDKAKKGDQLIIDFVGTINGEKFENGSANDAKIEIGSKTYLEGFEQQLTGTQKGDNLKINITFPEKYPQKNLAEKKAIFDIKVKEVAKPQKVEIDDNLAKIFGLENIEKLKEAIEKQLKQEYEKMIAIIMKKNILDLLEKNYQFEIPEVLYKKELQAIHFELQKNESDQTDENNQNDEKTLQKKIEKVEKNYGELAKRRVKLGILITHISQQAGISVSDREVHDDISRQTASYPGQKEKILELISKNPALQQQFSAPILERKTIDYIIEMSKGQEVEMNADEIKSLYKKVLDEDDNNDEDSSQDSKKTSKNKSSKGKSAKKAVKSVSKKSPSTTN